MEKTHCNKLAELFAKKVQDDGLVDVKFYLRNLEEAAEEQVCQEVVALYAAVEREEFAVLDFKDSRG